MCCEGETVCKHEIENLLSYMSEVKERGMPQTIKASTWHTWLPQKNCIIMWAPFLKLTHKDPIDDLTVFTLQYDDLLFQDTQMTHSMFSHFIHLI